MQTMLSELGLSPDQARACLALAAISTTDATFVDEVRALGVNDELLDTGLQELAAVMDATADLNNDGFTVQASLSLARGLDYYTGTVFEIYMEGFESLGSVGGGGRYDALASDGKTTYPGVGISFGISRTVVPLVNRGLLTSSRAVPSAVLVALNDEASRSDSNAIAHALRSRGIPTEVAASAAKFGKQIRYAERRGIPFVWFPGSSTEGTRGPGQGHPYRRANRRRRARLDPTHRRPVPAGDLST